MTTKSPSALKKAATLHLLENLGLTQICDSRHARTEFAIAGIHEARLSADDFKKITIR